MTDDTTRLEQQRDDAQRSAGATAQALMRLIETVRQAVLSGATDPIAALRILTEQLETSGAIHPIEAGEIHAGLIARQAEVDGLRQEVASAASDMAEIATAVECGATEDIVQITGTYTAPAPAPEPEPMPEPSVMTAADLAEGERLRNACLGIQDGDRTDG